MKFCATEFPKGIYTSYNSFKQFLLLALTLIFLTLIPVCFLKNSPAPLPSPEVDHISDARSVDQSEKKCDIFSGKWVPYPKGPYYTNATCNLIIDQQNCMKFGRTDTEFMKWRWRPDQCELPVFEAVQFLKLVRGKSMAFVGDSVGRNQMQSLLCLLSAVAYPEDISEKYTSDTNFRRWFYVDYNFTLAIFWSPLLVKAKDADPSGHFLNSLMSLKLDEADEAWASEVENFNYVIISAGQWFFRPLVHYENDKVVGCHICGKQNITALTTFYGYRMAFRTAFKALQSLKNYKGITFLRTYSPSHFENGDWNKGGNCVRTKPFTREELKNVEWYNMEMYRTQVKELKEAEEKGREKGLKFRLLATTEAMLMRPDGHPNHYGRSEMVNDCVHWCLPGPIDTWNELLLYMLNEEGQRLFQGKLMKNA